MKPVALVIMDGIGRGDGGPGDAIALARTPNLDKLLKEYPHTWLKAHGTAVGLPSDDDMGNSEVGHNALGCGQVYAQGAALVNERIASGGIYASEVWRSLIDNAKAGKTLHFLGLLSDGNVHSNISHLLALLSQARAEGVERVRIHILLDGRDVPATSALSYVDQLEEHLATLGGDYRIASGGGRMKITMDRYEADWGMVELGWKTHVLGEGRQFANATEAIETLRAENNCIDQDLPPFVIAENGEPVGRINNGDSVVLINFRGDRALEISKAFEYQDFDAFERPGYTGVVYAGMLQYDGDLHLPEKYLVAPPDIQHTLTELLVDNGINEYALSETQKYGHVTYFWNGNRSGKVSEKDETYVEILSDNISFDQAPRMKADPITEKFVAAMATGEFQFLRCNFPNGDMVGHTGMLPAVIEAVEAVDEGLGKVMEAADKYGYTLCITADHGNADQMFDKNKKTGKLSVRTAHSLNPVPFIVYDKSVTLKGGEFGLANVAGTVAQLLDLTAPACWEEGLLVK